MLLAIGPSTHPTFALNSTNLRPIWASTGPVGGPIGLYIDLYRPPNNTQMPMILLEIQGNTPKFREISLKLSEFEGILAYFKEYLGDLLQI